MKPKTVGCVDTGARAPAERAVAPGGIPAGTSILTADGALPVEYLNAGDRVVTRNGGMVRLERIESLLLATRPVVFPAGSLGDVMPENDLRLPAEQPVLIRDWRARALFGAAQAMVAAGQLVDGEFIRTQGPRRMLVYRLTFDRPRIVYAGGLELGVSCAPSQPLRAVA